VYEEETNREYEIDTIANVEMSSLIVEAPA
jgi:hypothetical protein